MSHALLSGELPRIEKFEKTVIRFDGGAAILREASLSLPTANENPGYFFHCHVEEEDLIQDVLLEARPSAHGLYVGLARFGAPLSTPGIRAAVEWLVGWLEGQGLRVVQRSY